MSGEIIDTIERAVATFAEAMLGCISVGVAINEVDWINAVAISLTATVASVLKSIVKNHKKEDEDDDEL